MTEMSCKDDCMWDGASKQCKEKPKSM
jgi:hypothetical protein